MRHLANEALQICNEELEFMYIGNEENCIKNYN